MNYCPFPLWWSDNPPLHVWIVLNWIVSCADGWLLSRESLIGPCHQILRLASMIFTEGVHTFEVLWNKLLMFFRGLIQSWGVKSTLILSASRHLIFWVDFKIIFVNFLETMCATSTLVLLLNFPIPAFEFFYILVFDFLTFNLAY